MTDQNFHGFIKQAALLAAQLERRTLEAVAEQRTAASAMVDTARHFDGAAQAALRGAQEDISRQTQQALRSGLAAELTQLRAVLDEAGGRCQQMMARLHDEQETLLSRTRILTWKILGFSTTTALALVVGTSFMVWNNIERNRQLTVRAEITQALQQVAVTSCGGKPCIKLDQQSQRWGKNGEYVLLDAATEDRTARKKK